jgi:hypothetical protein
MFAEWTIKIEFGIQKKDVDTFKEMVKDATQMLAVQAAMLANDTPRIEAKLESDEIGFEVFIGA